MYTQIQQFTHKIMSTSKTPLDFEPKKDGSVLGLEIAPESKIQKVIGIETSGDDKKELLLEEIAKEKESDEEATGSSRNEENLLVSENDDGYKTPTSPSHRIPSPVQCPPAPRKPKLKRKASPSVACRRLQFGEPADVEAILRALNDQVSDQDSVEETKSKKARRKED